MKNALFLFFLVLVLNSISVRVEAQADKATRPSPPVEVKGIINGANVTINYSSPAVKERTIWGDLVPYGKVWRTGANEATTFETDKDLVLQEMTLPAGKYSLFTIPGETEWTWIFNSVWDQWGAYKYDESKDVLRLKAIPQRLYESQERLGFDIKDNKVILYWEKTMVSF